MTQANLDKVENFQELDYKIQEYWLYNIKLKDWNDDKYIFVDQYEKEIFYIDTNFNNINTEFKKKYLIDLTNLKLNQQQTAIINQQIIWLQQKSQQLLNTYKNIKQQTNWIERINPFDQDKYWRYWRKNMRQQHKTTKEAVKDLKSINSGLEQLITTWNSNTIPMTYFNKLYDYSNYIDQINENIWAAHVNAMPETQIHQIDNYSDAKKDLKNTDHMNQYFSKFNDILTNIALLQLNTQEQTRFKERLTKVINKEIDPSDQPFVFKYYDDYIAVIKNYIFMKQYTNCVKINTWTVNYNWQQINTYTQQVKYSDWQDAIKKWWILWRANYQMSKTNMTPWNRETLLTAWSIWWMIWIWLLWFWLLKKTFKMIFNKDAKKDWKNRATLWWTLWLAIFTTAKYWTRPRQINKLSSKIYTDTSNLIQWNTNWNNDTNNTDNDTTDNNNNQIPDIIDYYDDDNLNNATDITKAYMYWFPTIATLFQWMKFENIASFIEKDNSWKIKLKYNDFLSYIDSSTSYTTWQKESMTKYIKILKQTNDKFNLVDLWLTSAWIEYEDIINENNKEKEFNNSFSDASKRLLELTAYLDNNKQLRLNTDPDAIQLLKDYTAWISQYKTIDEIKDKIFIATSDKTEVDEKISESIKYKNKMLNTIDKFTTDTNTKEKLKNWLNSIFDLRMMNEFNNSNFNLQISQDTSSNNYSFSIETYWKKTDIIVNDTNISIKWLKDNSWNLINFTDTYELFKVANLTNKILDIYKNKEWTFWNSNDILYFWWDFIKPNVVLWKIRDNFDKIQKSSISQKISPILANNIDSYINYLNTKKN